MSAITTAMARGCAIVIGVGLKSITNMNLAVFLPLVECSLMDLPLAEMLFNSHLHTNMSLHCQKAIYYPRITGQLGPSIVHSTYQADYYLLLARRSSSNYDFRLRLKSIAYVDVNVSLPPRGLLIELLIYIQTSITHK